MATNFKLKRSAVASKSPGITDLELGELALNTYDGLLYSETTGAGSTVSISPSQNMSSTELYFYQDQGLIGMLVISWFIAQLVDHPPSM